MDIISSIKNKLISQRGATAIMSAIILPLILAFGGMAVDVGNFYSHYSRLQNAADSAAMAGGHAFKENINSETPNSHPYTDEAAEKYTYMNVPESIRVITVVKPKTDTNGNTYNILKISLEEDVPYIFLRPLLKMLSTESSNGQFTDFLTLSANAYCMIVPDTGNAAIPSLPGIPGSEIFNNLFTFDLYRNPWYAPDCYGLTAINNMQNPDNPNIYQNINNCSTYDGPIMALSPEAKEHVVSRHDALLTSKAFENGDTTATIAKETPGAVATIDYDYDLKLDTFYKNLIDSGIKEADSTKKVDNNVLNYSQTINSSKISTEAQDKDALYFDIGNGNFSVNIDDKIAGDPNKPLYLIFDGNGLVKLDRIKGNMTGGRPIIFVYGGTTEVRVECDNGGVFNGIIYTPYTNVVFNDNKLTLVGSVAAKGIDLGRGTGSHYEFNGDVVKTPGTSGTSGTPATGTNHKVILGGADAWDD